MIDLFSDFETRSRLSVKDTGAWKYVAHPSTYPLMFAYGWKGDVRQWLHSRDGEDCPDDLREFIADPDVIFHAHNAGFEIAVYQEICVKRYGWPMISLDRWRDTAAKGCHANQPRALGNLCERLGTDERKDKYGKYLLNTLAIPQKTVKAKTYAKDTKDGLHKRGEIRKDSISYLEEHGIDLFEIEGKKGVFYWNNDRKLMHDLAKYNRQDIVAEQDADAKLPDLPPMEQAVWKLDAEINARGIPIDRKLCEGAIKVFQVEADICNRRIQEVAREDDGRPEKLQVNKCTENKRIVGWINERVNFGPSLGADIVDEWMRKPWGVKDQHEADRVREVLELKQLAGGTGVKKYWSALDFIQLDDRVREQLLYYGAATGRWAGKGIQPHNMVRLGIPEELFFEYITRGDHHEVAELAHLFGYTVMGLLKTCIRGMIQAPEGEKLVVSDFSGIESRVLQWLAGNEFALRLFREGADMYVHAASQIFDIDYDEMMNPNGCKKEFKDKRQVGKIACFGSGTEVLTDSGWKPIVQVTLTDHLWDGVEWCNHDGVCDMGVQPVLDLHGLEVTPDHDIFINDRKANAWQLDDSKQLYHRASQWANLSLPVTNGGHAADFLNTSAVVGVAKKSVELTLTISTPESRHDATDARRVFDILNVGNRSRFTIRTSNGDPLIVSNCLALGYGMGAPKYQATCENFGVKIDLDFAQTIVYKWRDANPQVVDLWKRVERACKVVIKNKKVKARIDNYLNIYWDKRGYLCIRLPSGRVLYYYKARLGPEGEYGRQIEYLDGGKQWVNTYGGKLIENIDQATSRDLLVHSAFVADKMGLTIIAHVHDELICLEQEQNRNALHELNQAMESLPTWAVGLPLAAEGYESKRYTK